jgi:deoxyribose-phosphate aldolase
MKLKLDKKSFAMLIDFTLLKPFATSEDIKKLCMQAVRYGFFSVCVNPVYVKFAFKELSGSQVKVCTVSGFPLGANRMEIKALEAKSAKKDGASEIDMVMNLSAFKSGDFTAVEREINAVVKACEPAPVKVIIETCYLSEDEKIKACRLIMKTGAKFVKTSTGFGNSGATESDVRLIKSIIGDELKIKAAGGIHTFKDAFGLIEAGADRIGTSAGVQIISQYD